MCSSAIAYIELLEIAEPEKIPPHAARSFSFGAFNRDFLESREGLSMLILNSRDAADDARAFEASGIGDFEVFDFSREGKRPDGTVVKLAFSLAFARGQGVAGRALCGVPASFSGKFLESGVPDPCQWRERACRAWCWSRTIRPIIMSSLNRFTGVSDLHSSSLGVTAATENGDVEIMDARWRSAI